MNVLIYKKEQSLIHALDRMNDFTIKRFPDMCGFFVKKSFGRIRSEYALRRTSNQYLQQKGTPEPPRRPAPSFRRFKASNTQSQQNASAAFTVNFLRCS